MGKRRNKKASMDVDKPAATTATSAAPTATAASSTDNDGWSTAPISQNPFMKQLLGEEATAKLASTITPAAPEGTIKKTTLGVAVKKIKKQESRKSKLRKAKKSAKAVAVAEKMSTRAVKEANEKRKKEKWKHLWE